MANNELFFNSESNDRVYNAESFRQWIRKFFKNGIFIGGFDISLIGDMSISVSPGFTHLNGAVKHFDSDTVLELDSKNSGYKRIDSVVIEYNEESSIRNIVLRILRGDDYVGTPVAKTLTRSGGVYQISLANILVDGTDDQLYITADDITDTRGDELVCGYVSSTVTEKTSEQLASEFATYLVLFEREKAEDFYEWFEAIKGMVSVDVQYIIDDAEEVSENVDYMEAQLDFVENYAEEVDNEVDNEANTIPGFVDLTDLNPSETGITNLPVPADIVDNIVGLIIDTPIMFRSTKVIVPCVFHKTGDFRSTSSSLGIKFRGSICTRLVDKSNWRVYNAYVAPCVIIADNKLSLVGALGSSFESESISIEAAYDNYEHYNQMNIEAVPQLSDFIKPRIIAILGSSKEF